MSTTPGSTKSSLPQPIINVPPGNVGQVVQRFISLDGVKQLHVTLQPDGQMFTITPENPETGTAPIS